MMKKSHYMYAYEKIKQMAEAADDLLDSVELYGTGHIVQEGYPFDEDIAYLAWALKEWKNKVYKYLIALSQGDEELKIKKRYLLIVEEIVVDDSKDCEELKRKAENLRPMDYRQVTTILPYWYLSSSDDEDEYLFVKHYERFEDALNDFFNLKEERSKKKIIHFS